MVGEVSAIDLVLAIVVLLGGTVGGGLGTYLSKAPVWKGAVLAPAAISIQLAVSMFFDIDGYVYNTLIYLLATGIIGGRWGMRLTARQMAQVVIGTILFVSLFGGVALFFLARQQG